MCPPPSSLPPPPQRQPPPPPPQRQPPPPSPPQRQPSPPQRQSPPPQRQPTPPPQKQPTPSPPQRQSPPPQRQPTPPQQPPKHQPTPPPQKQPTPSPPQQQQPSHPPPPNQPPSHPPPQSPQIQPQLQPHPPPYPFHYQHLRPKKKSSTLASCFLATSFLICLTIAAIVTCFILFRPRNPQISVNSMKFPSFTLQNGTANFTFFQYVAVRNPNRYAFSHYDSSLQLFSSSSGPLGFMYIPAGNIAAGKTQFVSANFDVESFTLPPDAAGPRSGPTLELETKMKLVGSVKVFKVFAHHVEKGAKCRVTIQVSDAAVLGYKC